MDGVEWCWGQHGWVRRHEMRGGRVRSEQALHLLERALQREDVVLGEEERGDLGEFAHGGTVCVRHHFAQTVQCRVEIVHALALATVHFESHLLSLLLRLATVVILQSGIIARTLLACAVVLITPGTFFH